MGCGASKSNDVITAEEGVTPYFEPRSAETPIFVSDTGAGLPSAFGRKVERSLKYREPLLVDATILPGTIPQHFDTTGPGNDLLGPSTRGGSLIMKHPPRKPQRLEEEQALMAVRSPKHKLVSSTGRINQKPSVQDVPEEDEDVEAEEVKVFALV